MDGTEPKLAVFSNKRQKFFNCFVLDQSKATATHTLADIPRNIRGTATEKGKIARVIYILYEEHTAEACEKEFSRTFERWQAALRALARSHCSAASRSGPSFLLLILFCVARCHRVGSHRCRQNHRCLVSSSSCSFFFSLFSRFFFSGFIHCRNTQHQFTITAQTHEAEVHSIMSRTLFVRKTKNKKTVVMLGRMNVQR